MGKVGQKRNSGGSSRTKHVVVTAPFQRSHFLLCTGREEEIGRSYKGDLQRQ